MAVQSPNFLFCCLDSTPLEASLLMNGFDLTDRLPRVKAILFSSRMFSVVASGAIRVARPPSLSQSHPINKHLGAGGCLPGW